MRLLFIIFAYLLGSLSSAIIVCRCLGLPDPRQQGSGNPGTTNVLRFGGKKIALLVFIGDFSKGLLPLLIARRLELPASVLGWTACAVIIGHMYPVFFGFKGGKGVATSGGALFGLHSLLGCSVLSVWLLVAFITRYSSLAALISTVSAPIIAYWLLPVEQLLPLAFISLLLIWRHRKNIRNLYLNIEPKIGKKHITAHAAPHPEKNPPASQNKNELR